MALCIIPGCGVKSGNKEGISLFRIPIVVDKNGESYKQLLPKQVDCFFGDAENSCRWRERRMFWVTWQNAREHIPSHCVAQFFLRASSQSSIFGFRC